MTAAPHFWIDVEDLLGYARENARPGGIQRVGFEICRAMRELPGFADRVGFVRHNAAGTDFVQVAWLEVEGLYQRLTADRGATAQVETDGGEASQPGTLKRLALRLPVPVRVPLGQMISAQIRAVRSAVTLSEATGQLARQIMQERRGEADGAPFTPAAGDVLLSFGAPWAHASYASLFRSCRERYGVRTGLLVHDLIPLLWPEWCQPGLPRVFRRWIEALLPECDQVFAVSQATRRDLEAYAQAENIPLKAPVQVIPMASGFSSARESGPLPASLPVTAGKYVLVTGTIEVRKNHALLFRVWRRMLRDAPGQTIPKLVFAGSPGWLTDDLMQQIRNSRFLDGHLVVIRSPSDAEMDALVRHCLFSVMPSFYEGWGLPVTECLARGRPCLIADTSSLPEASQGLSETFDPDCVSDALRVIRRMIAEPDVLEQAVAKVQSQFRPVAWAEAAATLVETSGAR